MVVGKQEEVEEELTRGFSSDRTFALFPKSISMDRKIFFSDFKSRPIRTLLLLLYEQHILRRGLYSYHT